MKETEQGFQVIDLIIAGLLAAIQAAKHNADVYTKNFKEFTVVEKPVEIPVKDAEFILECLQEYKRVSSRNEMGE